MSFKSEKNKENLRRKFSKGIIGGLTGVLLFGLSSCGPMKQEIKKNYSPKEEPVLAEYVLTKEGHFKIFDEEKKETELYLDEKTYNKFSKDHEKEGFIRIKVPGMEEAYIKAGQGKGIGLWNNLKTGGEYFSIYFDKKPLKNVFISGEAVSDYCSRDTYLLDSPDQIYNGKFSMIKGTDLETKCVVYDNPKLKSPLEGNGGNGDSSGGSGSTGGAGGSGGDGAGGAGGSGSGGSGGGR